MEKLEIGSLLHGFDNGHTALNMTQPQYIPSPHDCVNAVIEKVGKKIILGLPLGLGKANHFANVLFERAQSDPSIDLTIFTALTLERPQLKNEIEKRYLGPMNARIFGDYPELSYAKNLRQGSLPDNIKVHEFFLTPGNWMSNAEAQRDYISVNYSHASRTLVDLGVNVIGQLIAKREDADGAHYSLSCNTDVTLDIARLIKQEADRPFAMVGQVNTNLPFMPNDAEVGAEFFEFIIDNPELDFKLFGPPKMPVSLADYAAGFHAATLVKDGGTLQIGIGSLGDAIAYALILREKHNRNYRSLVDRLGDNTSLAADISNRETKPFVKGLYGASEMIVDGFLHLTDANVLKRRIYPDATLQRLLNEGKITETVTANTLEALQDARAISDPLTKADIEKLKTWGVLREDAEIRNGQKPKKQSLGTKLKGGIVLHGGFFLGPQSFYDQLKNMPADKLNAINMTAISYVNELHGDEALKTAQRVDARFINTAMMVTLSGAVVSDGLENGRVVSGVGGQYNFVAQAHALKGARSIIVLRATREKAGRTKSNIIWSYGHATIPRHLRDIVVTEYGIADLRGHSDREIIARLINIADSRFQEDLLDEAKSARKIEQGYKIPRAHRDNTPERLHASFGPAQKQGLFALFPFGTDLTDEEIRLGRAMRWLEAQTFSKLKMLKLAVNALIFGNPNDTPRDLLGRMDLETPQNLRERLLAKLVAYAIAVTEVN